MSSFTIRSEKTEMRFHLLGPLGVETDGGPVDLGPHKQRSVLAVLLLNANEIVPTDRIIDLVWGEAAPRTADHSVQIYVSDLRKALANGGPADLIETRPPGYVLNVPPESVDAFEFEHLVRDGLAAVRTGDVAKGQPKLERALEVWTAAPLADFAYEEFAQGYIRSLEELRSDALEALGGLHLDKGRLEEARDLARQAVEADSLREEPRRLMMLALYRSGRQAEALRHYGDYHELLGEELGIEPSGDLRDLEERILLQDATLSLEEPVTTEGNPYRGLRPFSEEDADVYFGRESLVGEVLDRLAEGQGFVSIVGPSGCGKSSAAMAGVTPCLRHAGDTVVVFQPGARPLWELAGAIDRAGFGSRASLLRQFEANPASLASTVKRPVVVIVDQFEELFTLAEPDAAIRFSELIATAIRDPRSPLRVVTTLRADYYDKPLSMPALAVDFADSVVSVKPMTPVEIESAVVEPARAAGVGVEPGLLAQLVSDMGNEPGALPLLQFTLFELFEGRSDGLTLADYERLGGLHGALTGGADELLGELDVQGRDLAEQLMMRMVQKGRALSTARPVPLRDLLDLGVDRVALQDVLEAFGSRRLITFDRDASGAAVVEMAHEYLISEWPQLETWIEEHSEDLDRLYALDVAAGEWVDEGRSEDYLLRGERLERFEEWRDGTSLRLTTTESAFVTASLDLRSREEADRIESLLRVTQATRSARRRLAYFGGAVAMLAAAVTALVVTLIPDPPPDAIVWYEGRGAGVFGQMIASGIDAAVEEAGIDVLELTLATDGEIVEDLVARGTDLLLITLDKASADFELPIRHPELQIVLIDCEAPMGPDAPPNVSCILLDNAQAGFVAGVASGLLTETGSVAMIGGTEGGVILSFQQGFEQGVRYVDPSMSVTGLYLTPSRESYAMDLGGYQSPTVARWAAEHLYGSGADVVFNVAGTSGYGLFEAAETFSAETGIHVWAIGVDSDEYETINRAGNLLVGVDMETLELWREHIATSALKNLDIGVAQALLNYATTGAPGEPVLDLSNDGIGYATSGGFIDHLVPDIDRAIQAVIVGDVVIDREYEARIILLEDVLRR